MKLILKLLCLVIANLFIANCYLKLSRSRSGHNASQVDSQLLAKAASSANLIIQSKPGPPCLAPDPLSPNWGQEEILSWQQEWLRMTRGYPSEVAVAKAVDQFNQDAKCQEVVGKNQPPLTIDEVISAARDNNYDDNFSPSGARMIKRIATEHVMPKGSLIWYDWGYNGTYDLTYWKIYLYVELDKHPLDDRHDDNPRDLNKNKKLVRLQYISSNVHRK